MRIFSLFLLLNAFCAKTDAKLFGSLACSVRPMDRTDSGDTTSQKPSDAKTKRTCVS